MRVSLNRCLVPIGAAVLLATTPAAADGSLRASSSSSLKTDITTSDAGDGIGSAEARHILHFSDVHLNLSTSFNSTESAEMEFAYGFDAPIDLLGSALQYAKLVLPYPDFFLYTGDHAVHGNPSDEYLAEAVKVSVATMAAFNLSNDTMLNATAILGNSDTSPGYSMDVTDPETEENPSIATISKAWQNSLSNSNLDAFNRRGYLSYDLDENIIVLTLNTVPYSPNHTPDTTVDPDPFGQFEWLNNSLLELRNASKFAYIVGHIPPIIDSYGGDPMWEASYIATYKQIVAQFADVIKAQLFGHVHSIEFRLPLTTDQAAETDQDAMVGSDGSEIVPLFTSAAISPIFNNNPAFMVWDFDSATYELLDFTVYASNISDGSQELDWHPIFNASTAFNVNSLSTSELRSFVERAAENPQLLEQYYYDSKALSYMQTSCDGSTCQAEWLCSFQWWATAEDYADCVSSTESTGSLTTGAAASVSSMTSLLCVVTVVLALSWA